MLLPSIWSILIPALAYGYLFSRLNVESTPVSIKYCVLTVLFTLFIASIASLIFQAGIGYLTSLVNNNDTVTIIIGRVITPSVSEEFLKAAPLLFIFYRLRQSFKATHAIVYAGLAAFTFALVEQILFSVSNNPELGANPYWIAPTGGFWTNTVYFGLAHGFYAGFTALGCAWAYMSNSLSVKRFFPWLGLLLAIVSHGLYNGSGAYDALQNDGKLFMLIIAYVFMACLFIILYLLVYRRRLHWKTT